MWQCGAPLETLIVPLLATKRLEERRVATWSGENPDGRSRPYSYEELVQPDMLRLDIFWLRDKGLEDSANLPDPNVLAAEIAKTCGLRWSRPRRCWRICRRGRGGSLD